METSNAKCLLTIGVGTEIESLFKREIPTIRRFDVKTKDEFEALFEVDDSQFAPLIFCGNHLESVSPYEVAQTIRNTYPQSRIVFLIDNFVDLKISNLKKNGASEVLLLPGDTTMLSHEFDEAVQLVQTDKSLRRYRAVQLIDISPGDDVPFDVVVYLPMNKKYIRVVNAGDQIRDQQYEKFKEKKIGQIFIPSDQKEQFYNYCAEKLAELGDPNSTMSETERREKVQRNIRDLFSSVYDTSGNTDYESGRQIMQQSQNVVTKFVEKKTGQSIQKQIEDTLGSNGDVYQHASSVSAIACLLSMATGIGNPEDLALAGLFHDVALVKSEHPINPDFAYIETLRSDERECFLNHPKYAQNLLKSKKMNISPEVVKIIEQHHERADGKGFPKQLSGSMVCPEAQLLAISDLIEYYGQQRAGQRRLTPLEAIQQIEGSQAYNIEIVLKVKQVLQSM